MANRDFTKQKRGLVAIDGAMALVIILLVVQIWLLSAALEGFLAGHHRVALPAAIFSGLLLACCLGLNAFVDRVDRESRKE